MKKAGILVFIVTALFFTGLLFAQYQPAFAAVTNNFNPALAYDPVKDRYLCVYENQESGRVKGQFVDAVGNPVGDDDFFISDSTGDSPSVAYGVYQGEGRYMVVWHNEGGIYGKLLDAGTGETAAGTINLAIAETGSDTTVVFDDVNERFLVVWVDTSDWQKHIIHGRLVNADGTHYESDFVISNAAQRKYYPSAAYDSENQRFLAVWADYRSVKTAVYGQLVNADGSLFGPASNVNFPISSGDPGYTHNMPFVVYNTSDGEYLVAWERNDTEYVYDIRGQVLTPEGAPAGGDFDLSDAGGNLYTAYLAYNAANNRYLAVWQVWDPSWEEADIYGQLMDGGGALNEDNFAVCEDEGFQINPAVAANSTDGSFLVAYEYSWDVEGESVIAYSLVTPPSQEPLPQIQFDKYEYNVNENAGSVDITVTLSEVTDSVVGVVYSTSDGTARAGSDYNSVSGTLNINPGEISNHFAVPILDDSINEGNETVKLTLSSPSGAELGSPDEAFLTIVDNDSPPAIQFSQAGYTVDENAGSAVITVTRSGDTNSVVSAVYSTSDGTAKAGSDYTSVFGAVYFNSGDDTKTFTVPILDDSINESNETVNLNLSNPSGATLGSPVTAVLTIVDNDSSSGGGSSRSSGGGTVGTVPKEQPPTGILIDRMPGYIEIGQPVKIDELREEIELEYNQALLDSNPKHVPRVYYGHTQAGKWVALAGYPAGDGKVKALNDGDYSGWFNVFGVIQPVFSDLKANHWAEQVINRMNGLGMIEGYPVKNGDLTRLAKADQNISRVEFAVLIYRILNIDPDNPVLDAMPRHEAEALLQSGYSDGDKVPDWAVKTVAAVVNEGLMVDRNGKLEADMPITRIEAAVMVSNALKTIPGYRNKAADLSVFADSAQIPEWANGKVENIIVGYPDGTLRPNGEITRAESLALLLRLFVHGLGW